MTLETSFIFTISLILLWIKPGPGQAAIITRSLNDGFFAGFCVAMGIVTGSIIFFIISAIGATFIQNYITQISIIFKIVGATYLFYIGYQGLQNIKSGLWTKRTDTVTKKDIIKNYITGLLITLSNPFVIFFFIGILPSLIPLGQLNIYDIFIGTVIVAYVGIITDTIIAALAAQVRTTLSDTNFITKINLITSIGFLMIGSFLLFSVLTEFDGSFLINKP